MDPRQRSAEAEAKDSAWERIVRAAQPDGVTLAATKVVVAVMFSRIEAELRITGRLSVPGFGVFSIRTRKARTVRNPVTKELMQLPETRTVGFRPAKALKGAL